MGLWRIEVDATEYVVICTERSVEERDFVLTEAESSVRVAMLQGQTNREIAIGRGTSERTVANQVASIFKKLGVNSRSELIVRSVQDGLESDVHGLARLGTCHPIDHGPAAVCFQSAQASSDGQDTGIRPNFRSTQPNQRHLVGARHRDP